MVAHSRMMLIGIGVDAVDLRDFAHTMSTDGEFFLSNFTDRERAYAGVGPHQLERLAGRFAGKEAVLKALGVGWGDGIEWSDIEVERLETGAPTVQLYGTPARLADERGVLRWVISLTHTNTTAIAVAIAVA